MPIYEFYCGGCNMIFSFYSSRINIEKKPMCPKCSRGPLERLLSKFAVLRGAKEENDTEMPNLDESKLERAMTMLEKEAGSIDSDDPKQSANLMRKLCDMTGLNLGSGMEEALRRMEAGEDPEQIEAEMGDNMEGEDPFGSLAKKGAKKKRPAPIRDETLYSL